MKISEGCIYTHEFLWIAGEYNLDHCKPKYTGKYFLTSAFLNSFLAFEGYLNFIGDLLYPEIWKKEKKFFSSDKHKGISGKLSYITENLSLDKSGLKTELKAFDNAVKLRNRIVHPKVIKVKKYRKDLSNTKTTWDNSMTEKNIRKIRNEFKTIAIKIYEVAVKDTTLDRYKIFYSPFSGISQDITTKTID